MDLFDRIKSAFVVPPPISKKGKRLLIENPQLADEIVDKVISMSKEENITQVGGIRKFKVNKITIGDKDFFSK
ncbi:MAG: hypothetical protein IPJ26_15965 [Bacteroidetes bacterium]|nr:hypothetical protein [Bacteroidota bacterium]